MKLNDQMNELKILLNKYYNIEIFHVYNELIIDL